MSTITSPADATASAAPASESEQPQEPTFEELGAPSPIVKALARAGKERAFAIQTAAIPDGLAGHDLLGRAKTGSGKTLAFGVPLVANLASPDRAEHRRKGRPVGLVLAPTRELATQIAEVITPMASDSGLKVTTVFGGVSQHRQEVALARGVDIVVACPGRLEDLMGQGIISLDDVRITVIDEADFMADLGFLPSVTRILAATPAKGQRMLFSATLDHGVDKLVKRFLHDPRTHAVSAPADAVGTMTHHVLVVADAAAKRAVAKQLASGTGRRIMFVRTKYAAKRLAKQFTAAGIPTVDLQGNLRQNARDRNLAAFESGEARVLIATDVAARGVDVDGVELVVHIDPPADHKTYLHRSGRTARAGSAGDVVTLALPTELREVRGLLRDAHAKEAEEVRVTPDSPEVAALVGERAAFVQPTAAQQAAGAEPERGSRQPGNGRGRSGGRGGQGRGGQGRAGNRSSNGRGGRSGESRGQHHDASEHRGSERSRSRSHGSSRGGESSQVRWSSEGSLPQRESRRRPRRPNGQGRRPR